MNNLIMLVGIPGSGKSTYVKNDLKRMYPNVTVIASDEVRNQHPDWNEDLIWPEIFKEIANIISSGHDVIFDATNVTVSARKWIVDSIKAHGVTFSMDAHVFIPNGKLSYERISKRNTMEGERYFPLDQLERYVSSFEMPTKDEGFSNIIIAN